MAMVYGLKLGSVLYDVGAFSECTLILSQGHC